MEGPQATLTAFRKRSRKALFAGIEELEVGLLPESFVSNFKFLLTKKASIHLAFRVHYSKGCLEGMNNKIKNLKRAAFGFRSSANFKKRLLLMNL